jgi:hypothetical protein
MKVGRERCLRKIKNQAHIGIEMENPGLKIKKSGLSCGNPTGFIQ